MQLEMRQLKEWVRDELSKHSTNMRLEITSEQTRAKADVRDNIHSIFSIKLYLKL